MRGATLPHRAARVRASAAHLKQINRSILRAYSLGRHLAPMLLFPLAQHHRRTLMRMRIVALTFGLGIAACGGSESRPVQDPSTTSATTAGNAAPVTTTYDTTMPASPKATTDTTTMGTSSMGGSPSPSSTMPASSTTRPATDTSTVAPAPAPNAAAVVNNPGVADQTKNADNTKINDRDRHGAVTPMDQGNSKAELGITAAIRKSVLADKTLSFTAKNVKIITVGSKVTLRGPVASEQEKAAIEARAKQTAGVTEVDNQLEIKK
jgi:hyperosmotically inducible protein